MKKLLIILLIIPLFAQAQQSGTISISPGSIITSNIGSSTQVVDCGTWVKSKSTSTEWRTVDTLAVQKKAVGKIEHDWVESRVMMPEHRTTPANYCQCGCGWPDVWFQFRVCRNTGIRQERKWVQYYTYIPKPKTEYEKALDSLSKQ